MSAATDLMRKEKISYQEAIARIEAEKVKAGTHARLTIDAVGLRKSDAASYALRLIGMMLEDPHDKGHSVGGDNGNASGKWEDAP